MIAKVYIFYLQLFYVSIPFTVVNIKIACQLNFCQEVKIEKYKESKYQRICLLSPARLVPTNVYN